MRESGEYSEPKPIIASNAAIIDDDLESKRPDSIFPAWYHSTLAAGWKGWCRLLCAVIVYFSLLGPLFSTPTAANFFLRVDQIAVGGWRLCSGDGVATPLSMTLPPSLGSSSLSSSARLCLFPLIWFSPTFFFILLLLYSIRRNWYPCPDASKIIVPRWFRPHVQVFSLVPLAAFIGVLLDAVGQCVVVWTVLEASGGFWWKLLVWAPLPAAGWLLLDHHITGNMTV